MHVENLKKTYGEFAYPPFKTQIDPDNETKQLQMFLPGYGAGSLKPKTRDSLDSREGQHEEPYDVSDANKTQQSNVEDEHMEGYGKSVSWQCFKI